MVNFVKGSGGVPTSFVQDCRWIATLSEYLTITLHNLQNLLPVHQSYCYGIYFISNCNECLLRLCKISKMDVLLITTKLVWMFSSINGVLSEGCDSPQYLEVGKQGMISCFFEEGFYVILWFNSRYDSDQEAILTLKSDSKTGKGLDSGEFDIYPNGSLIINNVSLKHDHDFSVIKLEYPTDPLVPQTIRVIVTEKPSQSSPDINNCVSTDDGICFLEIDKSSEVSCSVLDSRPAVRLDWFVRTVSSDKNVTSRLETTETDGLYSTHVSTSNAFEYSSTLAFLICKAVHPPDMLNQDESMVLLQNRNINTSDVETITKYVKKDTQMKLDCNNGEIEFVVWKKMTSLDQRPTVTLAGILSEEFSSVVSGGYILDDAGSLIVSDVDIEHEGSYRCIYGDGLSDGVKEFSVSVYVPSYPMVEGCNPVQYCTLELPQSGHLKCTVTGIRPQVSLKWSVIQETESTMITFSDQQIEVTNNGDTFDVSLTSMYNVKDVTVTRITAECKVSGSNEEIFDFPFKFDLHFPKANQNKTTTSPSKEVTGSPLTWIIVVIVVVIVGTSLTLIICIVCRRKQNLYKKGLEAGEDIPFMPSGKKEAFIDELKRKYENLYNEVQPVPYIRDRMLCVDKVFVEGGIELVTTEGDKHISKKLSSYHNILKDSCTRCILEGEPGYGKSTLSLQLVYDWCQSIAESPLKNTDILIFLRLRQLGGVKSILKAIKQFILPIDSQLKEEDISTILYKSTSVVIVLDGYDEYSDQEVDDSDVMNIIKGEMMQRFKVLLTTRTSNLPRTFAAHTKRLKLTGFDEIARDTYIKKAVVSNEGPARKLKRRLEENPIIGDLCQVPLFFVMFAHMVHENKKVYDFKSVTMCFRHVVSCFHMHMRNKLKDKNNTTSKLFETDHHILDEIAFKGLSGKAQKIVWDKQEFSENVGDKFYAQYIQIGILVEEDVLDIQDEPGTTDSGHIQYKKEVRFYHKLFCEWYAAHHLANKVIPSDNDITAVLKNMNPYDLQYLYRFSCGLNPDAAKKIIQHIKSIEDGDKFAVLCTLEQTGKVDQIKETIQDLFTGDVIFSASDSKLLQRSTIQLLEIASANEISIERVELYDCIESVNVTDKNLIMKSGIHLSNLSSVNELVIYEEGRELTFQEAANAVKFASQCHGLNTLGFYRCILPQILKGAPLGNFDVWWSPGLGTRFRLNLQSRRWERREGGKLTEADYHDQVHQFNERQQSRRTGQESADIAEVDV
ncbi:NLR family CARD domain-containing protein 4 [Holothuria leucospilota]|uniref:NLR family CARD domain-containing protein 4 n=1 Tax=Holothuria leucospilota TaxID=206669 RepID=A0A9Q1CPW2_HOLLE|nr:NLR family CARD domain-containing protein 4 [Holothuria leucospilota]